jgi:RimJ/RimL family protein N-acetyltransferase
MPETTPGEWWHEVVLPTQIETERLLLKQHTVGDAPALKAVVDANIEHLRAWMPWAMDEPSPLDVMEKRIETFAASFNRSQSWSYTIRRANQPAIIGGCAMHAEIGPNALEIGYWLDARETRHGYATEAVAALIVAAFATHVVDRLETRCDPENLASAAIPRRLGFAYITTLEKNSKTPGGDPRDTMVFELTHERYLQNINHATEHPDDDALH